MTRIPPLIEVVFGVVFERLDELRAPHLGLFWAPFKEDFPKCEHQSRVGSFVFEGPQLQLPLPRVWFVSKDETFIIQVQDDRFLLNWRRTSAVQKYPEFASIKESFLSRFQEFHNFVHSSQIGSLKLESAELGYINHVTGSHESWDAIRSYHEVFEGVTLPLTRGPADGTAQTFRWECRFDLPNANGQLGVVAQNAKRKVDNRDIIVLELRSRGLGSDTSSAGLDAWFEGAHTATRTVYESLVNINYRTL